MYAIKKSGMSVAFPENKISSDEQIKQSQMPWYEIICNFLYSPCTFKTMADYIKIDLRQ